MKIVGTFQVNHGRWISSNKDYVYWGKKREWKPLHFMEILINPSLFPKPLFGKIQTEMHCLPTKSSALGMIRGAIQMNDMEENTVPISGSEITTTSERWQLLESEWFEFPFFDETVMFWLEAKNCAVAMFTLLLGVEE